MGVGDLHAKPTADSMTLVPRRTVPTAFFEPGLTDLLPLRCSDPSKGFTGAFHLESFSEVPDGLPLLDAR